MAVQELFRRLTTPRRLVVFAAIGAAVALSAALATGPKVKTSKEGFRAVVQKLGDDHRMLIVSGKVETPTPGWTATLSPAEPQGSDRKILILDLKAREPRGSPAEMASAITVRYAAPVEGDGYAQVTVKGDADFTLDVTEAN